VNEGEVRQAAEEYIAREFQQWYKRDLAISVIREFETCWVVVYNTREYVETKANRSKIIGNSPLIINKHTGVIRRGVSRLPIEAQVDET
jgi:hypothetical protein